MKSVITLLALIGVFIFSCSPKTLDSGLNNTKMNQDQGGLRNTTYFVQVNGEYLEQELDIDPVSNHGSKGFLIEIYKNVKYPPQARSARISGTVLIELTIDEQGNLINSMVNKGIGYGCDEESLRVVNDACRAGFKPAIKNGEAVMVRFNVPVKFKLG